ncbi:hypothetical protein GIB67_031194 [Kingdonia uniflora]|uniref:EF-hand domain-containing protein n=1 Tax=Kingdonia uniflora TaxID=39325 RepID=A0A7J7NK33_9MAGN|nr:hypothetical protein GIB67_031194 [Kingdonia uniflora]
MLDAEPKRRPTAQQALDHPWLQHVKKAPNVTLGKTVKARLNQFSVMNKLKKRALMVVAEHLSVEEVTSIKEPFQLMYVNNNGKITLGEFKTDIDGNGTLDFGEYVTVAIHLRKIRNNEYLHKAFTFFDKNKSGYIEIEELRDTLADEVDTNNEEVITAIIHDVGHLKFVSDEERLYDGHGEKEPKVHAESDADGRRSLKVEGRT